MIERLKKMFQRESDSKILGDEFASVGILDGELTVFTCTEDTFLVLSGDDLQNIPGITKTRPGEGYRSVLFISDEMPQFSVDNIVEYLTETYLDKE